jgi:hypothetical protein
MLVPLFHWHTRVNCAPLVSVQMTVYPVPGPERTFTEALVL